MWTDTPEDRERKISVFNQNNLSSYLLLVIPSCILYLTSLYFLVLFLIIRNALKERTRVRKRRLLPHKSALRMLKWQRK